MLNKNVAFLVLALTCLFLTPISALAIQKSNFDIDITSIKNTIFEDEIAEYNLTITNNMDFEETFMTPYTSDGDWVLNTDPLVFKVPSKSLRGVPPVQYTAP